MSSLPTTETKAAFRVANETFQTWYRVVGDLSSGTPLVTLHGGPGAAHYYLTCLNDVASTDRAVVLYDQLGCGQSTHLPEKPKEFWTPALFMDELESLLKHLRIETYDLLGHSWGGMLGAQFAAERRPRGLRRLIISDSPASMLLWCEATGELLKGLPKETQEKIKKHEEEGTTNSEEYQEAMGVFYARHLCRLDPMPDPVAKSLQCLSDDPTVYSTMNGPSEFYVVGSLKTWSVIDVLERIQVPTLVINGRYDEAQDICVVPFFQRIPKVKWVTFAQSSHMPQWEERERYMKVIGEFLRL